MTDAKATRAITRTRRQMASSHRRFAFNRDLLPHPTEYFISEGVKLLDTGGWRSALCPFHNDTKPSLRVFIETGAFRCMACGAKGGDVLAFHMRRHGLGFIDAAKALGAWEAVR